MDEEERMMIALSLPNGREPIHTENGWRWK
jgi:hypothetical protein